MQEFNKGVYDYIIATDESGAVEQDTDDEDQADDDGVVEECSFCMSKIYSLPAHPF